MPVHIAIPEPTSFDSAYNQRSLPQYLHALHAAGATPIPIPLHESPQRVAKVLSTCHGVLLPGSGADIDPEKYGQPRHSASANPDPARTAVDELLIQDAFNLHKPILAICYGTQALNVWLNGTLIQDIPTETDTAVNHAPGRAILEAHPIEITPATRLAALIPQEDICPEATPVHQNNHPDSHPFKLAHDYPGHIYVNSSHHQAIRTPGDNLIVAARSPQDNIIEAVELASHEHWVVALQWHPERSYVASAFSRNLFAAFVQAAESWLPRRIEDSILHA